MDIRCVPDAGWRLAAQALKGPAGKEVRNELTRSIRASADPVLRDLRAAVRAIPVTSARGGGTEQRHAYRQSRSKSGKARRRGLRATTATATRLQVLYGGRNPGVRFMVARSALPKDQERLPQFLNRERGWRHPLFGNRRHWYMQRGRPWFDVTIRAHRTRIRNEAAAGIGKALDTIAGTVNRG